MSQEVMSVVVVVEVVEGGNCPRASCPCNDDDVITTEAAGTPPTFKGDTTLFHPGSPEEQKWQCNQTVFSQR